MEKTNYTILLTGARAPATLDLARNLAKSGMRIVTADSCKYTLCEKSKYVFASRVLPSPVANLPAYTQALNDVIDEFNINLLIPTCEEIFHISEIKNQLDSRCEVFCEEFDKLIKLHDKGAFIDFARQAGLSVPKTRIFQSQSIKDEEREMRELLASPKPFVLKPAFTRFSNEVLIAPEGKLNDVSPLSFSKGRDLIYQEYIKGQQACSYSIAYKGEILAHSAYKTYYTAGRGATIYFEPWQSEPIFNWSKTFVEAADFTGQIAFDFICTQDDEIFAIECNPRTTSGIHLLTQNNALAPVFRDKKLLMDTKYASAKVGLAMILYSLPSECKRPSKLFRFFSDFFKARDVTFDSADLSPFFYQFSVYGEFMRIAKKQKITLTEATTIDIQWDGNLSSKV